MRLATPGSAGRLDEFPSFPAVKFKDTSRADQDDVYAGTYDLEVVYDDTLGYALEIQVDNELQPGQDVAVKVISKEGEPMEFLTTCRIDTPVEIEYYRNGGILHTVLRKIAGGN